MRKKSYIVGLRDRPLDHTVPLPFSSLADPQGLSWPSPSGPTSWPIARSSISPSLVSCWCVCSRCWFFLSLSLAWLQVRSAFCYFQPRQWSAKLLFGYLFMTQLEGLRLTWLVVTSLNLHSRSEHDSHGDPCWLSSGAEKQKTLCFLRRLGRTQCSGSSAQNLSTNKHLILHNVKCLQVGCQSKLQVSSSLEKVNLCQSERVENHHQLEGLFHPDPQGRHWQTAKLSDSRRDCKVFHLLKHPTVRDWKAQCTRRELFSSETFKRKLLYS